MKTIRKFLTGFAFTILVFVSGYIFGLKSPDGYIRADKAKDAVKTAYYLGQHDVVLESLN